MIRGHVEGASRRGIFDLWVFVRSLGCCFDAFGVDFARDLLLHGLEECLYLATLGLDLLLRKVKICGQECR